MKNAILDALEDRYTAQISEADATIKIYLENSLNVQAKSDYRPRVSDAH